MGGLTPLTSMFKGSTVIMIRVTQTKVKRIVLIFADYTFWCIPTKIIFQYHTVVLSSNMLMHTTVD